MKYAKGILLLAIAFALAACGNNSIVENVSVKTNQDSNQDLWVTLTSQLNMGGLAFPALTIPIANPKFPSELLGSVGLQRSLEGKNLLAVSANLTEISKNQFLQDNELPNGTPIPVSGLNSVVSVRFNSQSKIYFGGSDNSVMFGVALAIPLFDNIGKYLPGVNLFLPLPTKPNIEGLGGVFTGSANQSGIGLFVKVPSAIKSFDRSLPLVKNSASLQSQNISSLSIFNRTNNNEMKFLVSDENNSKSVFVKKMLMNLSLQKRALDIK